MGINITPVTSLSIYSVKKNFEALAREAESLQRPKDSTYLTSAPGVNDLSESQSVYALIAGTMYRYSKVNGAIYRVGLTAV